MFKGVGSIALQYILQFCVLQAVRTIFDQGTKLALHVQTSPVLHKNSSGVLLGLNERQTYNQFLNIDSDLNKNSLFDH